MEERGRDAEQAPATDRYDEVAKAFRVLSDPMRLRILGLLAGRPSTGVDLARQLGLSPATVSHHLGKLERAALVTSTAEGTSKHYALNASFFDPRSLAPSGERHDAPVSVQTDEERERARTLRHFFDGRRLKSIPARRKQLVIVIQELLGWFQPGRDYPEREVNDILREAHEDVATLRRELVDYGYMHRAHGIYRVASVLPARSPNLQQEMTGDERAWLAGLLASASRQAIDATRG